MPTKGPETSPLTNAMVIYFMALVRKLSLRKLDPLVETFRDFADAHDAYGYQSWAHLG